MARCEACGELCEKTLQVQMDGRTHHFDSFECAIGALGFTCDCCGSRVLGHGVKQGGSAWCARCARQAEMEQVSHA